MRRLLMVPENLRILESGDDACFPGKKKCTISFSLPPGSYATVVIEEYFG